MMLDASEKHKLSSAEAMWMFKVKEQGYSLRSCDDVPKFFQTIFRDSDIANELSCHTKRFRMLPSLGLRPILGKGLCNDINSSEGRSKQCFMEQLLLKSERKWISL